jgi:hypothetical protein
VEDGNQGSSFAADMPLVGLTCPIGQVSLD